MPEDPMIIAVRLREALLRLQPTLYERLDEDTWRVRYRNPIEEGHPWKIVYDALTETPEKVEKAAAWNEALERVAYAAQALEDAWLGFFKKSNTATMKVILQVEMALCDSLAALRLINGDAVRDWEAVEGKQPPDNKPTHSVRKQRNTRLHELKTWPTEFSYILRGRKTNEFRQDDRGFQRGDTLQLREWNPDTKRYTGRFMEVKVTDLARGPDWGIPVGYVVMSIMIENAPDLFREPSEEDPGTSRSEIERLIYDYDFIERQYAREGNEFSKDVLKNKVYRFAKTAISVMDKLALAERLVDIMKAEYKNPGESRFIARLRQLLATEAQAERYHKALADILELKDSTMEAAKIDPCGGLVNQNLLSFNVGAMLGAAEQALHPTASKEAS